MKLFRKHIKSLWHRAMPAVVILLISFLLSPLAMPAKASAPERGYRGFVEWSNSLRRDKEYAIGNVSDQIYFRDITSWYTGLSTSHGYQINRMWFVGVGLGYEQHTRYSSAIVPFFAEGRLDLQFGKATPFADMRLGVNLSDGGGLYFSPSVGYRLSLSAKVALNLSLGLSLRGYKVQEYDVSVNPEGYPEWDYTGTKHHVDPLFTCRLGFEF